MNRRSFMALLGGTVVASPLAPRAEARLPVIGVLVLGIPDPATFLAAFREGLRKVGHVEGQTIRLELRSADGKASALGDLAAELVRLKVDVIVVWQTPAAQAAKRATSDIPIVMAQVGDAVATGLVASLARPGGNVTGNTGIAPDLMGKTLDLVREVMPSARRVVVLANATDPFTGPFLAQIEQGARTLDIAVDPIMAEPGGELGAAFEAMRPKQADAVIVQPSLLHPSVAALALKQRLPSFAPNRLLPVMGGLMSYGGIHTELWRDAAVYVDKILKGSRPADLPVAQVTRFELVINLRTARSLGLDLPPLLLARADEVIE
jgi:ABC-type uncharacterized transport system substrate-binding protein